MSEFCVLEDLANIPVPHPAGGMVDVTLFAGRDGRQLILIAGQGLKLLLTEEELYAGADGGDKLLAAAKTRLAVLDAEGVVVFLDEKRPGLAGPRSAYSTGRPF